MTLTRFLTAYLYNPPVLWLTRRRLANGLPALGVRTPNIGTFVTLLAAPTLLTMLVSGLWHGAGYLVIIRGALQGVYLTLNHAWRLFGARRLKNIQGLARLMPPIGFLISFFSVVVAMALFRSTTTAAAREVLMGMLDLNGIGLPQTVIERFGPLAAALRRFVDASFEMAAQNLLFALAWLVILLIVSLLMSNTLQILDRYAPTLAGARPVDGDGPIHRLVRSSPSLLWAAMLSVLAVAAVMLLDGQSEFLYWQF